MNSSFLARLIPLFALSLAPLFAADGTPLAPSGPAAYALVTPVGAEKIIADLAAADDERTAAIVAADRDRLEAILSNGLGYAHSTGRLDSKLSFIESLVSHETVYASFHYYSRDFQLIAPGIALMRGHALIMAGGSHDVHPLDLNFLAVWRLEDGHWRFLAWQSCKNPPPPGG